MVAGTIHIQKEYGARQTTIEKIPLDKIRLDPENVRFRHLSQIFTDKEIEKLIWDEQDTKDLLKAILASGGLSERPVVKRDKEGFYVVKEGNRRIVCCRKARAMVQSGEVEDFPKDAFDMVECEVLPDSITEEEIAIYLARVHVSGKKEWDAINQAEHIHRLYDHHALSYDRIRELVGMGKAKIIQKHNAYTAMVEFMQAHPESADIKKFSFFEELYKRPELREWIEDDPSNKKRFFEWVAQGKFNITGAKDVRQLPEVLKDPDARKAFESPNGSMAAAQQVLSKKNPAKQSATFWSVEQALEALRRMPRNEYEAIPDNLPQVNLLKELYNELGLIFKRLGIKG